MVFTIELESLVDLFRLRTDQSWRTCSENKKLEPTDLVCKSVEEAVSLRVLKGELQIGDTTYEVEPEFIPSKHPDLHYTSSIFRKDFPKIPSRDQLVGVIRQGNDSVSNSLILNGSGDFELLPRSPSDPLRKNPNCVVRFETFQFGNDYVGVRASNDDALIDNLYVTLLECWVDHLMDGSTKEFVDTYTSADAEALLRELDKLKKVWVPQY